MNEEQIEFEYKGEPERLDKVILNYLEDLGQEHVSRSVIQKQIEKNKVFVNGTPASKNGMVVFDGNTVALTLEPRKSETIEPSNMDLDILHEDEHVLVINKPAGIVVHPGAGIQTGTIANALVFRDPKALDLPRAGIVHRLDKDTSGVMAIAKTVKAHIKLSQDFAERKVKKEYRALVLSTPRADRLVARNETGTIDQPIGRHPKNPTLMAVVQDGRSAVTHWQILERMAYGLLLAVKIETGRTHQIRAHMSHAGSPVIGDKQYGDFSLLPRGLKQIHEGAVRHALHAYQLQFEHPESAQYLKFKAEMPQDFLKLISEFQKYF